MCYLCVASKPIIRAKSIRFISHLGKLNKKNLRHILHTVYWKQAFFYSLQRAIVWSDWWFSLYSKEEISVESSFQWISLISTISIVLLEANIRIMKILCEKSMSKYVNIQWFSMLRLCHLYHIYNYRIPQRMWTIKHSQTHHQQRFYWKRTIHPPK